jgi:trehalose 6-phosphate phosphatase
MRHILSADNRSILERFAVPGTLVALDFDGTLAPIVPDRDRAALLPATRKLLAELAGRYPCLVISGRARGDLRERLRGTGINAVIGNHGIEPWNESAALENRVRRWLPALGRDLGEIRGVDIENKRFSLAVHYRGAADKDAARDAIETAARALDGARLVGGKQVLNIVPARAPHKGTALQRHLSRSRCRRAIYVGDDDTDEDVFALADRRSILGIRIGRNRESLAAYYLRRQPEIDAFLRLLLELRTARTERRRTPAR